MNELLKVCLTMVELVEIERALAKHPQYAKALTGSFKEPGDDPGSKNGNITKLEYCLMIIRLREVLGSRSKVYKKLVEVGMKQDATFKEYLERLTKDFNGICW